MVLGTKAQLAKCTGSFQTISVAGTVVEVQSKPVRNLGVMFDQCLNMYTQVSKVVKDTTFSLYNISLIRKSLTTDATRSLVNALVTSRMDYCNSLLSGVASTQLQRIQSVQNYAARVIARIGKFDHVSPVLHALHWLPVKFRIDFKIAVLVYKALNGLAPEYISSLLQRYQPARSLRSEASALLTVPRARLCTAGDRSFRVYAPKLWNTLPHELRVSSSLAAFKRALKFHLFGQAYPT